MSELFSGFPRYPRYRSLGVTNPLMQGEDVWALQGAIVQILALTDFKHDGIFGPLTRGGVIATQRKLRLVKDGVAGGQTQTGVALWFASRMQTRYGIVDGALHGQLQHESSCRLGNYSPQRPNKSFDAGVAQRNTSEIPARDGFNVAESVEALAVRVRQHFDLFKGVPSARRWRLAQGSWNAPAWACQLAWEEGATGVPASSRAVPSAANRATFEAYMASVSVYVVN